MDNNRRADAVLFGFDFQVNAAIVLMLENIKDLSSLKLEGNNEDIDIELRNGKHILAQAKAIVNSSQDFANVRNNLKKALKTLAEGSEKVETEKAIYITNSPNPLKEEPMQNSIFWGHAHREYNTLPDSSKDIIASYLREIEQNFDVEKLTIQVLPFETDNESERYKVVMQVINGFIGDIQLNIPGLGKQLHRIWKEEVFVNGSKKDPNIILEKKNLIWPLIVIATDISYIDQEFRERFDSSLYEEVEHKYKELIDSCCEKMEFFTRILYDYNEYKGAGLGKERCLNFVDECWQKYVPYFESETLDQEVTEALSKVIMYSVIRRRYDIQKIKKGVVL